MRVTLDSKYKLLIKSWPSYTYDLRVLVFWEGGKPEYPDKNPRREINYDNSEP